MTTDSRDITFGSDVISALEAGMMAGEPAPQPANDQLPSITVHELVHKVPEIRPRDRLDAFTRAVMTASWTTLDEERTWVSEANNWVAIAQEAMDAVDSAIEQKQEKSAPS